MLIAMASWLESVISALTPCCLSRRAAARAISGALPEFSSATWKRSSERPACFNAWLAVPTARRIESAQLGVALEPVRSITWPMVTVAVFGACCLQAVPEMRNTKRIR